MIDHLLILAAALLIDRWVGDPDRLWQRLPHPVVVFGRAIGFADKRFNRADDSDSRRRRNGEGAIGLLILTSVVIGLLANRLVAATAPVGMVLELVLVAVLLAQKSLADHVGAVLTGLREGGLSGGRKSVAMIVGRDPQTLDEAGVVRASIESLAENASDGIVAPAFWYAVFGLPGLIAYKMINTADSMIGHRTDRHRAFGRAAARIDDLANWLPARLTGALICAAAGLLNGAATARRAWNVMMCDAGLHRSPNAGWPEAAMAGALDLSLGGPRIYADDVADEPFMHDAGRRDAGAADIDAALAVFWRSMTVGWALVVLAALVFA